MALPLLAEDYGPRFAEAEESRVEILIELEKRLEEAEQVDLDRPAFGRLFRLSMHVLELDQETVARKLRISRPTVSRWESGVSAPHPIGRKPVFQLFKRLAKEKLRRHRTLAA